MRLSTINTSLSTPVQARQNGGTVVYRGTTSGSTVTELFIDNQSSRRLVPDNRGAVLLRVLAIATNLTTGAQSIDNRLLSFNVSAAGVITQVNAVQFITGAGVTPAALANQLAVGTGSDNGLAFNIVAASGSTPAYIQVAARGAAGATVAWEVVVDYVETNANNG